LRLGEELQRTRARPSSLSVICNVDATPVREPEEIRESLQDQVTGTVRWTETMEYLVDDEKCDLFIELGPGGVLAGLLNRTSKGTPCVSITDVPSLDAALGALRG
jgi:[acyl-carrier-protein] S-malonyltransferase